MMRTSNPVLRENTFRDLAHAGTDTMTLQGTVNKTLILLLGVLIAALWTWDMYFDFQDPALVFPWMVGGAIGGLVMGLITTFKKTLAAFTAPLYALLQGLFMGGLSARFEANYPGIVIQATENFKLGVAAATGGIFFIYMATMLLGLFGIHMPFIHESGLLGIGFSLFVVIIAALNLVLDFDFIENAVVIMVWLYVEILRLLSKLRR
jgi:uncharacterized YccA/Bax inhibitor family protein